MNGFEALKTLRTALPSGEPETKPKITKQQQISKTEEERANNDWLESFGGGAVINKNGIRKFVAHTSQPKQQNQAVGEKIVQQAISTVQTKKPIIKTVADDDELLRLMGE
ncbi:MAG: hypothetical protein WCV63_10275 [Negativicutes bacterium]|jgi:hypothetical protein